MGAETLAVMAIASAVVGSAAQIQAAKAQKKMYERQADITERQSRLDALAYKQQGVNAIKPDFVTKTIFLNLNKHAKPCF